MKLRAAGIPAEVYPDAVKMKKQMTYANDKHVPYVAMVGENELASNTIALKNMETGEQQNVSYQQLVDCLLQK